MYIEYYINSVDDKYIEIKDNIDILSKNAYIKNMVSTPFYAKLLKKNFTKINVGAFLDYPISSCDPKFRSQMVTDCAESNIDFLCITLPFYLLVNRKYDQIREDIKKNIDSANGKELRYILEYRKFDHQILTKICEILVSSGIKTIYPSSGFFIDNLDDNIIASTFLHNKTSIKTIINGNAWTNAHFKQVLSSGMYGFSSNSITTLQSLNNE